MGNIKQYNKHKIKICNLKIKMILRKFKIKITNKIHFCNKNKYKLKTYNLWFKILILFKKQQMKLQNNKLKIYKIKTKIYFKNKIQIVIL